MKLSRRLLSVLLVLSVLAALSVTAAAEKWTGYDLASVEGYPVATPIWDGFYETTTDVVVVINPAIVDVNTRLNVREGASTANKIIGKLVDGDIISVLEKGDNWSEIVYNGTSAYVYNKYISMFR